MRFATVWATRVDRRFLVLIAFLTLLRVQPVSAQSATPEVVSPSLCTVKPLTESELTEIVAQATPSPTMQSTPPGTGTAVDQETLDAVTATIRESVACTNANDPLRTFALFTDGYLQARFGGANQDDLGSLIAALTRTPTPASVADSLTLVSIADVRELADGRIAASVTTENERDRFSDTVVLAKIGGRWLIDEVVLGEPEPAGTPAA